MFREFSSCFPLNFPDVHLCVIRGVSDGRIYGGGQPFVKNNVLHLDY